MIELLKMMPCEQMNSTAILFKCIINLDSRNVSNQSYVYNNSFRLSFCLLLCKFNLSLKRTRLTLTAAAVATEAPTTTSLFTRIVGVAIMSFSSFVLLTTLSGDCFKWLEACQFAPNLSSNYECKLLLQLHAFFCLLFHFIWFGALGSTR